MVKAGIEKLLLKTLSKTLAKKVVDFLFPGCGIIDAVIDFGKHKLLGKDLPAECGAGESSAPGGSTGPEPEPSNTDRPSATQPTRQPPTPTNTRPPPSSSVKPPNNPTPQPVDHFDCANDNSNMGHYIPRGRYWQQSFASRGATVTGGWVLIGAHTDGGNHRARVGIYAGSGLSAPLATVEVAVTGYDGEHFQFPSPVRVSQGQRLFLAVQGIGDFTAYNSGSGCFISHVSGTS